MKNRLATLILITSLSAASHAAGDRERAALANLLGELDALNRIVGEARSAADSDSRTSFNYTALERDLEQVRQGIRDFLNRARREPRELPPLSGGYGG